MSSTNSKGLIVVLDSAALIAGTDNLFSLGGLVNTETGDSLYLPLSEVKVTFYSIPEVFHEIRDPRARARLALLQGSISLRAPSSEAVAETIDFAKRTGDFSVLSLTDLKVIALTRMLEREANGDKFLKTAPSQRRITEIRIGRTIPFDVLDQIEAERQEDRISSNEEKSGGQSDEEERWQVVSKSYTKSMRQKLHPRRNDIMNKNAKLVQESDKSSDFHEKDRKGCAMLKNVEGEKVTREENQSANQEKQSAHGDNQPALKDEQPASEGQPAPQGEENTQSVSSNPQRRRRRPRRRRQKPIENEHIPAAKEDEGDGTKAPVRCVEVKGLPTSTRVSNSSREIDVEEKLVQNSSSDKNEDSDSDGIEWINEFNLEEHVARDRGEEVDLEKERSRVACVTTDFAMQNTMLQMGLKLLSVDGRRSIQKIKHFALRCHSCGVVTSELERKFCGKCGNSCMHRVAYKIDKNGVARAYLNPKKKASLRGTKYPIPLPRGGRHNRDLILREDQIDPVKQRRLQKQRERMNVDVLDPSNFYNAGAKFNPYNKPITVGYGRRNPNEVRGGSRGTR
ncbi:unnamed protein product [Agarophyton chilense]|eukprot:gb/GEZJ01001506.1/.p1 GENE.gb/GEZJ01001506.1/~~gb/GEZJ01001506.1/.p1  ORF type:complete len:567 (+),score=84.97 gb/GEZJ01001506.1/:349-2049(+)